MSNLNPGDVVSGQTLLERVGQGGAGEVWKADYAGQTVAVKILVATIPTEDAMRATSAQVALGNLSPEEGGRFFPRVHQVELQGTPAFIRMDWIAGRSLRHHFRDNPPWSVPRALGVAERILEALTVIHSHGYIHGDLSPSNVILCPGDLVVVIDVGYGAVLAQPSDIIRSTLGSSEASQGQATLLYAAPERFSASLSRRGGATADVFSFGMVFFELLTWDSPRTVRPPSRINSRVATQWDEFVFKCVETAPNERFQNASAALVAFRSILGGQSGDNPHGGHPSEQTGGAVGEVRIQAPIRTDTQAAESRLRQVIATALLGGEISEVVRLHVLAQASSLGISSERALLLLHECAAKALLTGKTVTWKEGNLEMESRLEIGGGASQQPPGLSGDKSSWGPVVGCLAAAYAGWMLLWFLDERYQRNPAKGLCYGSACFLAGVLILALFLGKSR